MRLSHLVLAAATLFSFSHQATAAERTRNLSGPTVHDEYSWPILGHWKSNDNNCNELCDIIIKPWSTHSVNVFTVTNGKQDKRILGADYQINNDSWRVKTDTGRRYVYIQYENGKIYGEYGTVWTKVSD